MFFYVVGTFFFVFFHIEDFRETAGQHNGTGGAAAYLVYNSVSHTCAAVLEGAFSSITYVCAGA